MIPVDRAHLFVAADSHPGMSGKNNEDRYAVSAFRLSQENPQPALLAVLADGIGGHKAGEVAAEAAVETISQTIADSDGTHPLPILREAIIQASQQILALSDDNSHQQGMGATCACTWIIQERLYIAYAGDSRIYLLRGNTIQQLTNDHTWVQEAILAGVLTPEQARGHPNAHVIRRYLGSRQPVEPDTRLRLGSGETDEQMQANQGMYLQPNDRLVLCSDGLSDLVEDHEILATFKGYAGKKQPAAIEALIDLANARGGHDNITIIAIQAPEKASQTKPLPAPAARRSTRLNWKWTCLGAALAAIVIGAFLLAGIYWLLPKLNTTETPAPVPSLTQVVPVESLTPTLDSLPTAAPEIQSTLPTLAQPTQTNPPVATYTPWPTNPAP